MIATRHAVFSHPNPALHGPPQLIDIAGPARVPFSEHGHPVAMPDESIPREEPHGYKEIRQGSPQNRSQKTTEPR
jgi:hypothetical protein